jgi:hypothetical protein
LIAYHAKDDDDDKSKKFKILKKTTTNLPRKHRGALVAVITPFRKITKTAQNECNTVKDEFHSLAMQVMPTSFP